MAGLRDRTGREKNGTDAEGGVEARLVDHPAGHGRERFVRCRSHARAAKERAMLEPQRDRLSEELLKVDRCLHLPSPGPRTGPVERRIGRWQGRSQAAARQAEADLVFEPEGGAGALRRSAPPRERSSPLLAKGWPSCCAPLAPRPIWPSGDAGPSSSLRPRPSSARPSPTPACGRSTTRRPTAGKPTASSAFSISPRNASSRHGGVPGASAPVRPTSSPPVPPSAPWTSSHPSSEASASSTCACCTDRLARRRPPRPARPSRPGTAHRLPA